MRTLSSLAIGVIALSVLGNASARNKHHDTRDFGRSWPCEWKKGRGRGPRVFNRISTFANYTNNADLSEETVSEIVAATKDGQTLVYTDSPLAELGFVDITDPAAPAPLGKLALGGEPTSAATTADGLALVAVNTSDSFVAPDGYLAVVDIATRSIVAEVPLGGQPDSVAVSPDGLYAAIAIENERDEDIVVEGEEGGLPQLPAGYLAIVDLVGAPSSWTMRTTDLTGLAGYAPEDPEPEFVDINSDNLAVVTMQENNHVAVVELESGDIVADFTAGTQTLVGVDNTEDGVIDLSETLEGVPREPDAVTWIDDTFIGTANEGDLFGGSRGFSIFDVDGTLLFDTGTAFDEIGVRYGHYPEDRSGNKGTEPESIEYARFGHTDYLFVGSERGSYVAVYTIAKSGEVEFSQLLPAPLGPEGITTIPERGLVIVSGEVDDPSFGVRSSMMIYELDGKEADYPQVLSGDGENGKPIPWSALSGLTGMPGSNSELLAVWDSYYSESRIFTIDASEKPAVITSALTIEGGTGNFDPEGITVAPDGTYWVASEGNASGSRPNRVLQVATDGTLLQEVGLPAEIEACRAASAATGSLGSGFEGLTVVEKKGKKASGYELLIAQQRGWNYTTPECEWLDDDPSDVDTAEPRQSRIWTYDPTTGQWGGFGYALEELPEHGSWVGLSEISAVKGGYIVIERDNRTGDFAELKTLVYFSDRAIRDGLVTADEKRVFDLRPSLSAGNGWISDKPEGVGITNNGMLYLVTDNDGVDDWSGETTFLDLGNYRRLFRR
jgi:DNA-binding beta-propeller fold protein YncE